MTDTETQPQHETLVQKEHRTGWHRDYQPITCHDCWPDGPPERTYIAPAPALPPVPAPMDDDTTPRRRRAASTQSLGESLARIRAKLNLAPGGEIEPDPLPACTTCRDARFLRKDVPVDHPDFGQLFPCPACKAIQIQGRLEKLWGSLPSEFRDWTLDSYLAFTTDHFPAYAERHAALVSVLRDWMDTGHWLYLYSGGEDGAPGGAGRGKTGLGIALLKLLIERGLTGIFISTADLLQHLRNAYADHSVYAEAGRKEELALKSVDVLVLDEIGAERSNDWSIRDVLGPLIQYRHAHGLRTIFTSNLDFEALSDHLGHTRIPSRIRERTDAGTWMLDLSQLPDLRKVRKMAF